MFKAQNQKLSQEKFLHQWADTSSSCLLGTEEKEADNCFRPFMNSDKFSFISYPNSTLPILVSSWHSHCCQ